MPIRAQMADGNVLEFPDGTPDSVVDRAARNYIAETGSTSPLRDIAGAAVQGVGQIVELPGQVASLVGLDDDFDNAFTRTGQRIREAGTEFQSPAFRAQQEAAAARVAEAERESGFLGGLGQQTKELVTDPLAFAAGLAQTAPAMIGTGGTALLGRAAAARLAGQAMARRGAMIGAGAGAGTMVGGDAGSAVYERVMATPEETLQRSDVYRGYLAEGMAPAEARQATAMRQARLAAAPAAAVSALTAGLGGIESALLTGALRGGITRGAVRGGVKEAAQEGVEEGSQGVSENLAVGEIDPTVQPLDNVGGRVGAGVILGGGAGTIGGAFGGRQATEEPIDETTVTPTPPLPTEPGTDGAPVPVDVPSPDLPVPGVDTQDGGESVSVLVDGAPRQAFVTPEPDGNVVVEWDDGSIQTMPATDWDAIVSGGVPDVVPVVAGPVAVPVQEPVVEAVPIEASPVRVSIPPIQMPPPFVINRGGEPSAGTPTVAEPAPVQEPTVQTPATPASTAVNPAPPSWVLDNAKSFVELIRQRNPDVLETITRLHAQDLTAKEIAASTGLDVNSVRDIRIGLGLPDQGKGTTVGFSKGTPAEAEDRAAFEAWRDNYFASKESVTPEPAPVTPAATAPTPSPIEFGFKTAKGSTYVVNPDGTTVRNKAKRGDAGHEGDFGQKKRTDKTVYVDTDASSLSAAGLQGLGPKGARVIVKDGKATLLTWNEAQGRWGASPSGRDVPVYEEPAVGRYPLELWSPKSDVPGYEAYSNMHAGNAITEVFDSRPAPITQADFDAADTPTSTFEAAVKGKTLPAVADYLAGNATLPTVQRIMGRAAGVLRGLEQAGVKTEFGVSGQRPKNFMSEVMGQRRSGVRGVGGVVFEGDGTPRAVAAIAGMRRANPGTQEITTAHEIIHSITMSSVRNTASLPKDSRVRAAADGLRSLHKEVQAFYKSASPEMRDGATDYRVSDPDELIAYGLTDYNFQQFLMRVPTKTGNAFTDFVQYIARLLGVPKGEMNALTRLIELSEDLIPVAATEVDAVIQGLKGMSPSTSRRGDVASDLAEQRADQRDSINLPPESEIGTDAFREGRFGVDRFRRMWVDRFERLRQVESLGELASAAKSFYEAARRMNSVAAERIDKFRRDYFDPIQKVMRENGIDLNSVDWFLLASAAPQRNRRIEAKQRAAIVRKLEAEEEKKYGDGDAAFDAEVDAAILAAYEKGSITQSASGLTTAEAEAIVNDYMTGTKVDAFRRIADLYRAAVRSRMELAVQRGLISRPLADKLLREEPDYAPLKGRAAGENTRDAELDVPDADAESMMGYGGQGIAISGREWFDTQGRSTLPFSPFSTFISDTATSVIRGERNAVSQLLMQFMEANPINGWKIFSATNPPRDANGRPRIPSPLEEDFLLTKRGGKTYWLRIPDPLTIRAARELSKAEMQPYLDKGVLKLARTMTRLLGRSFTTLQPSFFTVNYVRDIQAALLNVISEQQGGRLDGSRVAANFFKEATSKANFKALADFEFNRENPNSPQELRDLIEQWKIDGGTVSWIDRKTPQEVAAEMRADFAALNDTETSGPKRALQKGSRAFKAGVRALENANNVFEGMTRFAAYKAALDAGATREQAAMLSREITVDFQRAGETAQFMNNFYLFMNANIQGTARTLRSLKSPQVRAILGGAVATAATLAAYNAAVSGEDDDGELFWDKIPEYEKDRNLIIMNPNGGGIGVKIPMPYGFGFFTGIGTRLADAARRGDGMGKVAGLTLSSALTNFSPVQFAGDNLPSNIAAATVPTILKPVADLWRNENFMSKPIYNEPFDSNQAKSSAPRYNTPEVYKWWAKTLNELGGGEGKIKSPIGLDTPAEGWEYLVNFASGGVGNSAASLFVDSAKLAGVIDGKKDLGARDLPILRRFITEPAPGRNVGDYYENANNAATVQREMRDSEDRADFRKRRPVDTHPRVVAALTRSRSEIRGINEQRKALDKRDMSPEEKAERKAELKARVDAAYIRFNKVYNEVEEAAR